MIRRVWKNREEKNGACLFLVNYLLVSFLIFGLYNARYGASIFEERYMIASFFVTVLIAAVFLDGLEDRSVLSVLLTAVMAGSILMVDVHSDYNYLRTTNEGRGGRLFLGRGSGRDPQKPAGLRPEPDLQGNSG